MMSLSAASSRRLSFMLGNKMDTLDGDGARIITPHVSKARSSQLSGTLAAAAKALDHEMKKDRLSVLLKQAMVNGGEKPDVSTGKFDKRRVSTKLQRNALDLEKALLKDKLSKDLRKRESREALVRRSILFAAESSESSSSGRRSTVSFDGQASQCLSPSLQGQAKELDRRLKSNSLSRFLEKRPSVIEVQKKGILFPQDSHRRMTACLHSTATGLEKSLNADKINRMLRRESNASFVTEARKLYLESRNRAETR